MTFLTEFQRAVVESTDAFRSGSARIHPVCLETYGSRRWNLREPQEADCTPDTQVREQQFRQASESAQPPCGNGRLRSCQMKSRGRSKLPQSRNDHSAIQTTGASHQERYRAWPSSTRSWFVQGGAVVSACPVPVRDRDLRHTTHAILRAIVPHSLHTKRADLPLPCRGCSSATRSRALCSLVYKAHMVPRPSVYGEQERRRYRMGLGLVSCNQAAGSWRADFLNALDSPTNMPRMAVHLPLGASCTRRSCHTA